MKQKIHASFSVGYEHQVHFTRGVFRPDNPLLTNTLASRSSGRMRQATRDAKVIPPDGGRVGFAAVGGRKIAPVIRRRLAGDAPENPVELRQ